MTEDEAKTKMCPNSYGIQRFVENGIIRKGTVVGNCCASGCMAWRWLSQMEPNLIRNNGYCGLAGKPEVLP